MRICGIIPEKLPRKQAYIVEVTEDELDKLSGISKRPHISGRYKIGNEVKVALVYERLEYFEAHKVQLANAEAMLRSAANSIKDLLPGD